MRTQIKIIGLGKRMKGTSSKTGKDYDFQSVSFAFPDKYTDGVKAANCNMQGADIDACGGLKLNDTREAFIEDYRGVTRIVGIL